MDAETQVIDVDGSCRDVNFPDVNSAEAIALIKSVQRFCRLRDAFDSEGKELSPSELVDRLSSSGSQSIVSYWLCEGLVSQIQLFFSWQEGSKIFVELTFFPQDVDRGAYSLKSFLDWLRPFLVALKESAYYVRYENASWVFGDASDASGVIFTNAQYPING
ncbi:hypothetical protein [Pseudomonas songnenensis]|jgi:hypothetical protein|uniref:hypothetical protein n=1 Tax=Pseudomonas songnenensis TaxID=1176259 RepID=UPI0028AC0084|nr:hypothetical protein [Pseudomonas songnenensis]